MYSLTVNKTGQIECSYEENRANCIRNFFNSNTYINNKSVYLRNHDKFYIGCYKTEQECKQKLFEITGKKDE